MRHASRHILRSHILRLHRALGTRCALRTCLLAATLSVLAATLSNACVDSTPGERVDVPVALAAPNSADESPQTSGLQTFTVGEEGTWRVQLTAAEVVITRLSVYAPPSTQVAGWRPWRLSRAHAHAGDDNLEGAALLAELRTANTVDPLTPSPGDLGLASGRSGEVDKVSVSYGALASSEGDDPVHLRVKGNASDGSRSVEFEAHGSLPETPLGQRLNAISLNGPRQLTRETTLQLRFLPEVWFAQVDFDQVAALAPDRDGVRRPTSADQMTVALSLGLRNPQALLAELVATEPEQSSRR